MRPNLCKHFYGKQSYLMFLVHGNIRGKPAKIVHLSLYDLFIHEANCKIQTVFIKVIHI